MGHKNLPLKSLCILFLFVFVASLPTLAIPVGGVGPNITKPANGAVNQGVKLTITAAAVTGISEYTIQIAEDSLFNENVVTQSGPNKTMTFEFLSYDRWYYVHAKTNLSGFGNTSKFRTKVAPFPVITSPPDSAIDRATALNITAGTVMYATEYTIQVSHMLSFDSSGIKTEGDRTIMFDQLKYGTRYYVRARTNLNGPGWGPIRTFMTRTAASLAYVTSPANGSTGKATTLNITCNTVPGAQIYGVIIATDSNLNNIVQLAGPSPTRTIPVSGLAYSTTYYTAVITDLSQGIGPIRSFTTKTAESISYITAPGNGATNIRNDYYVFRANNVPGATEYTIQLSEYEDFSLAVYEQTDTIRNIRFEDLDYGKTYYNRVKTDVGGFGEVRSFTTRTVGSVHFVTSPAAGAVNVNTSPYTNVTANLVYGAFYYKVELSLTQNFDNIVASDSGATRYRKFTGLANCNGYYNRVITNVTYQYEGGPHYGEVKYFVTGGCDAAPGEGPQSRLAFAAEENETASDGSTESALKEFDVQAFPNPFRDEFSVRVESSVNDHAQIMLTDITGRIMKQAEVPTNVTVPLRGDFAGGLYLMRVRSGSSVKTVRMIKKD